MGTILIISLMIVMIINENKENFHFNIYVINAKSYGILHKKIKNMASDSHNFP